jgi:hypothetical protein
MNASGAPLIAPIIRRRFDTDMAHENNMNSEEESQPASTNIRERVKILQEKASQLNQTLDRVEETLQEAAGESKE